MNPQVGNLLSQAVQHFQNGSLGVAESLIRQALQLQSKNFDALHILGVIKGMQGQHDEARKLFDKAILINPQNNYVHFNYAKALSEMGRDEQALNHFQTATRLAPSHIEAWLAYGASLAKLNKTEDAIQKFEMALSHNKTSLEAWINRGLALAHLKRFDEAKKSFENALSINMTMSEVWLYRGNACLELVNYQEALNSFIKCLELDSNNLQAHYLMGNVYSAQRQFADAVRAYEKTIELDSNHPGAYNNRGYAFLELKEFKRAITDFQKTLSLISDAPYTLGALAYAKLRIGDWAKLPEFLAAIKDGLLNGAMVSSPFQILSFFDDPSLQKIGAEIWMRDKYHHIQTNKPPLKKFHDRKIRIAYFSPDFHDHPVAFLTAELFELHDKERFEIYAFSMGPHSSAPMRQRLEKSFTKFIEVGHLSDDEIVELACSLGIDVAIDMAGLTAGSRSGIFVRGVAPIQVNYLGYPGTLGSDAYDYIIADRTVIPESDQQNYIEKVAYLPLCFQPNDRKKVVANNIKSKVEYGLPATGFIFCCFNNSYKINSEVFDSWMKILLGVDSSVLWLSADNPEIKDGLRSEAVKHGVSADRIIFAERTDSLDEHLGRQRLAGLFLDTFPFNAHTTASDALWAGLPVLTREGSTYASRVAASLLRSMGLGSLVTHTHDEYESMAIDLANHPEKLENIKAILNRNVSNCGLFDTPGYTRSLEDAYIKMLNQKALGLPAISFTAE